MHDVMSKVQSLSLLCMLIRQQCAWNVSQHAIYVQILVLGFCDNQRDEELIWKILSQVLPAILSCHDLR